MPRYGLIGEKLGHSFSKPIHEALGGYPYELIPLAPDELAPFLKAREFDGLNVTIPYKQAVIPYLDALDDKAREIGAVNTIVREGSRLIGSNTDYDGFRQTLLRFGIHPAGKRCLVLGTGGASRPVCAVLRHLGAQQVRTVSRNPGPGSLSYEEALRETDTALLVNTTPVGMFPDIGRSPISLDGFPRLEAVVDLIYNPLRTDLVLDAAERGLLACGGLYMLVWQAKAAAGLFAPGRNIPSEQADALYGALLRDKQNLVLTGMPMSGKSTVGQQLADRLGREWIDTDTEIERRTGQTIPELFERFTEAGFRRLEQEVIDDVSRQTGRIISTGGGVPLFPQNVRNLRRNGVIVFLDRPLSLLTVGPDRPLARSDAQIAALFQAREPIYRSTCDLTVVNDSTPGDAVRRILSAWEQSGLPSA